MHEHCPAAPRAASGGNYTQYLSKVVVGKASEPIFTINYFCRLYFRESAKKFRRKLFLFEKSDYSMTALIQAPAPFARFRTRKAPNWTFERTEALTSVARAEK